MLFNDEAGGERFLNLDERGPEGMVVFQISHLVRDTAEGRVARNFLEDAFLDGGFDSHSKSRLDERADQKADQEHQQGRDDQGMHDDLPPLSRSCCVLPLPLGQQGADS